MMLLIFLNCQSYLIQTNFSRFTYFYKLNQTCNSSNLKMNRQELFSLKNILLALKVIIFLDFVLFLFQIFLKQNFFFYVFHPFYLESLNLNRNFSFSLNFCLKLFFTIQFTCHKQLNLFRLRAELYIF